MKNRIVLGEGGVAPDFAVSMEDMEQSVTSFKEELKL
uniref:Uncharacterized protein n=1 Tax=Candidatus Methanophaga sp. ANME-1 ERB7 TaxID=2759913 RepID=A0A7G9Z7R4_9EURY|nr:hypothetical protein HFIEAGJK_00015 [Methanosarcinales archaeon ANME-1 ERB7]